MLLQSGLFVQFAVHGLQRRLVAVHAALRKLPAVTLQAPRPKHLAAGVQQHDTHTWTKAVGLDHGTDSEFIGGDRKSTRLNSSHSCAARMPSSARKKKKQYENQSLTTNKT